VDNIDTEVKNIQTKVKNVETKINEQEDKHDDLRQRSMKGNIIVGSPEINGKPSLAFKEAKTDQQGGLLGRETDTDVALRLIKAKTGVEFQHSEIQACHPIGKGRVGHNQADTYVVRVWDRSPGSNWEILQTERFHLQPADPQEVGVPEEGDQAGPPGRPDRQLLRQRAGGGQGEEGEGQVALAQGVLPGGADGVPEPTLSQ
jgi:hypothetical protein